MSWFFGLVERLRDELTEWKLDRADAADDAERAAQEEYDRNNRWDATTPNEAAYIEQFYGGGAAQDAHEVTDQEVEALNQEQARDYAERGPDMNDYWTKEEEDNWNNFRETPEWALYPDVYRGHEYNQAKDAWAGRSPTPEDVAEAEEEAYTYVDTPEVDYDSLNQGELDELLQAAARDGVRSGDSVGPAAEDDCFYDYDDAMWEQDDSIGRSAGGLEG